MTPPKPHGYCAWHPDCGICAYGEDSYDCWMQLWVWNEHIRWNDIFDENEIKAKQERYLSQGWQIRPRMLVPPEFVAWVEKAKNKLIELNDVGGQPVSRLLAELEEIEKGMG